MKKFFRGLFVLILVAAAGVVFGLYIYPRYFSTVVPIGTIDLSGTVQAERVEGQVGHYIVTVNSAKVVADEYTGKSLLIVSYDFTNNSLVPLSFFTAIKSKAYQEGRRCETRNTSFGANETCPEYDNIFENIAPGETLEVFGIYDLLNNKDTVIIEIMPNSYFAKDKIAYSIEIERK